jgi:hypothetical protein
MILHPGVGHADLQTVYGLDQLAVLFRRHERWRLIVRGGYHHSGRGECCGRSEWVAGLGGVISEKRAKRNTQAQSSYPTDQGEEKCATIADVSFSLHDQVSY